jgi:hypothetical protein
MNRESEDLPGYGRRNLRGLGWQPDHVDKKGILGSMVYRSRDFFLPDRYHRRKKGEQVRKRACLPWQEVLFLQTKEENLGGRK